MGIGIEGHVWQNFPAEICFHGKELIFGAGGRDARRLKCRCRLRLPTTRLSCDLSEITSKSEEQKAAEGEVESFQEDLGPFVVAAETTRMAMVFTDAKEPGHPIIFANDAFLSLDRIRPKRSARPQIQFHDGARR